MDHRRRGEARVVRSTIVKRFKYGIALRIELESGERGEEYK